MTDGDVFDLGDFGRLYHYTPPHYDALTFAYESSRSLCTMLDGTHEDLSLVQALRAVPPSDHLQMAQALGQWVVLRSRNAFTPPTLLELRQYITFLSWRSRQYREEHCSIDAVVLLPLLRALEAL